MNWFKQHCAVLRAPDVILHCGAGAGQAADVYRQFKGTRIVFVDPQPQLADHLRDISGDLTKTQVLAKAVSRESGQQKLHVLNLPALSALQAPGPELFELFPGLSVTRELNVDTVTLSEITADFSIEPGKRNWLVIDAPGSEVDLVSAVLADLKAQRFERLFLRCSPWLTAKGDSALDALLTSLGEAGYQAVGQEDDSDPDWPFFHFELNRSFQHSLALEQELVTLNDKLAISSRELEALRDASEQKSLVHDELQKQLKSRAGELEQLRKALEQKSRESNEFGDKLKASAVELEALRHAQEKRAKVSDELEREALATQQRFEERIAKLTAELEAQDSKLDAATLEAEKQSKAIEDELHKARADLSVSVRTQAMKEADLRDLQERYGALREQKLRQQELLTELGARLKIAAEFLKRLDLNSPDKEGDRKIPPDLVKAFSGELEP